MFHYDFYLDPAIIYRCTTINSVLGSEYNYGHLTKIVSWNRAEMTKKITPVHIDSGDSRQPMQDTSNPTLTNVSHGKMAKLMELLQWPLKRKVVDTMNPCLRETSESEFIKRGK